VPTEVRDRRSNGCVRLRSRRAHIDPARFREPRPSRNREMSRRLRHETAGRVTDIQLPST
jgi:hypothetical protein